MSRRAKESAPKRGARLDLWISIALAVTILVVYSQVRHFDFINYDDPDYGTANPHIRTGLTSENVTWAFTSSYVANWIPLTWISHMLDFQFFGPNSGWHHLTNVVLHAISTLLLFLLLRRITGATWRSAFVAFAFAIHPLHVESVAWIAERKDVLCGLFCFLTLWAYVLYVEHPVPVRYFAILVLFLCALLSKQMAVTLPVLMLLLDYWPLRRMQTETRSAILEKLPLFAMSAGAAIVAYIVQRGGGAVSTLEQLPLLTRIENAVVSYAMYLLQCLWPVKLSVFYPYPHEIAAWQVIAALAVIAAFTALAFRRTYVAVGWLWYLVALAPVIGLVQIGVQARADRYTYLPLVGVFIAVAWGVTEALQSKNWGPSALLFLAAVACNIWIILAWTNVQYWQNSEALFRHAVKVTEGNYVAYNNLGSALRSEGKADEALNNFVEALKIRPSFGDAQNNLGELLLGQGRVEEATPHIVEAVRLQPNSPEARVNLGSVLIKAGKFDEAEAEYRRALQLQSDSAEAHSGLGVVLTEKRQFEPARDELAKAIELKPDYTDAHYNLGRVLGLMGQTEKAVDEFKETIRRQPDNAQAHYNLGTALAGSGHLEQALDEFRAAVRLDPDDIAARFNLASALASLGRFDEAIPEFSEVLRRKPEFREARESLEECKRLSNAAHR